MADERGQWWEWSAWRTALAARPWLVPWLVALLALDLLLVGAVLGGAGQEHIVPVGTLIAGTVAAFVALGQLGVARRQAVIAAERH